VALDAIINNQKQEGGVVDATFKIDLQHMALFFAFAAITLLYK